MAWQKAYFWARSDSFLCLVIQIHSRDIGVLGVAGSLFRNYLNETRSEPVNPLERMDRRRTGPWLR